MPMNPRLQEKIILTLHRLRIVSLGAMVVGGLFMTINFYLGAAIMLAGVIMGELFG